MLKQAKLHSATLLGFLAILLWSSTVAFTRSISVNLGPFTSGASIYLLAGFFLYMTRFIKHRTFVDQNKPSSLYIYGCGLLFLIYTVSFYIGISMATNNSQALEIGLINYLWPGLTILFSIPILGKKASIWLLPGTFVAFTGVYLVLTQGTAFTWISFSENFRNSSMPYISGFLAATAWALYSNLTRRWGGADSDGAVPLFSIITGLTFLILAIIFPENMSWNPRVTLEIFLFSLATALAYLSWDMSMRKGKIILVAAGSYLVPLLSTIVSSIYLQIMPTINLWWGCFLIVLGSIISWRSLFNEADQ
jgi:drug/metabolite transporter (DMT)-like permease